MPRLLKPALYAAVATLLLPWTAQGEDAGCHIFVLKAAEGDLVVATVAVPPGKPVELSSDVVTFLLPYGPGQSGDVIQGNKPKATTTVRCQDGALHVTVQREGGQERAFPPVPLRELAGYNARVSVITGGGLKRVFMIRGYASVEDGDGPAVDMFGGLVPLAKGDYAVTIETSQVSEREDD